MSDMPDRTERIFWAILIAATVFFLFCTCAKGDDANAPAPSIPWREIVRGLPSREVCVAACKTTKAHIEDWCKFWSVEPSDFNWGEFPLLDQMWIAREVWVLADQATNPVYEDWARQKCVIEMIEYLGWKAVLTGQLPTPLP